MRHRRFLAVAAVAVLFVSACGSSMPATSRPASATQPASSVAPGATAPPAATKASVAISAPTTTTRGSLGTPAAAGGSGGTADICGLLTPAELSSATGKTYLAGSVDIAGQCQWNTNASGANSGDLIIAAVQPLDLGVTKSMFGTGGTDVTVAGHPAFYNPGQGVNSLWVDIGGGNLLILSFPRSGDLDPSYQAIAVKLAEDALAKM